MIDSTHLHALAARCQCVRAVTAAKYALARMSGKSREPVFLLSLFAHKYAELVV